MPRSGQPATFFPVILASFLDMSSSAADAGNDPETRLCQQDCDRWTLCYMGDRDWRLADWFPVWYRPRIHGAMNKTSIWQNTSGTVTSQNLLALIAPLLWSAPWLRQLCLKGNLWPSGRVQEFLAVRTLAATQLGWPVGLGKLDVGNNSRLR
jgi:hypothetical protein